MIPNHYPQPVDVAVDVAVLPVPALTSVENQIATAQYRLLQGALL